METEYLIISTIVILIGIIFGIFSLNDKSIYAIKMKITSAIFLIIGIIILVIHFTKTTTSQPSRVLFGVCLATNVSENNPPIKLSQILKDIDIFWDWQAGYSANLYDITENDDIHDKYVPMQWGPGGTQDIPSEYMKSYPKYVFSWNEPDMIGTVMSGTQQATSAGFWTSYPFPYGNAITGGVNSTSHTGIKENTTYGILAEYLKNFANTLKGSNTNVKLATPVTAMSADISRGCAGVKQVAKGKGVCGTNTISDQLIVPQPCGQKMSECDNCGEYKGTCNGLALENTNGKCEKTIWYDDNGTKRYGGACNGWLDLVKSADSQWWDKSDMINIHCYNRFAHLVKLHVLETIAIFKDDIHSGKKQVWLTECACIYSKSDIQGTTTQKVTAKFAKDLLWNFTDVNDLESSCKDTVASYNKFNMPEKLPGFRSNDTFTYLGKTGSWYEHGFGAFTWFTAVDFAGFNTGCSNDFSDVITSNIWTDGKLNEIWNALINK